jgi:transposase-like protein
MKTQCPNCHGFETIKHGKRYNQRYMHQLFFCKTCNKNFIINEDFKRMRFKPINVLEAVYLYNKGMKAEDVVDYLENFKKVNVSVSSVLSWNKKYKDNLDSYVSDLSKIKKGYKNLNKSTLLKQY